MRSFRFPVNGTPSARWIAFIISIAAIATSATGSHAAMLTFDQFTDVAKTTRIPNNLPANQFYGDKITNFSPTSSAGGQYVNYGSHGGLTPNVSVAYRWYDTVQPTNPNPNNNGPGGVFGWNTQYGGLQYIVFADALNPTGSTRWLSEIQFTPDPGYRVRINRLDYAGFQTSQLGQTLKILAGANSVSPQLLWAAGADGAVAFPASAATLTPLVTGATGQTVSILWGVSDRGGLDNISFSQIPVPEPASAALCCLAALTGLGRSIAFRRTGSHAAGRS